MHNRRGLARIPIVAAFCLSLTLSALPLSSKQQAGSSQKQNSSSTAPSAKPAFRPDANKALAAYKRGLRAEHEGNWQAAFDSYSDAVSSAPNDAGYFSSLEIAKGHVVQEKMDLAERKAISGRLSEALRLLISVRALDPSNRVLQARYAELSALFRGQIKSAASAQELAAKFISNIRPEKRT